MFGRQSENNTFSSMKKLSSLTSKKCLNHHMKTKQNKILILIIFIREIHTFSAYDAT